MTVNQVVLGALETVLHNSWAIELPSSPTWPALVFDTDTDQEEQWCVDGGYDQHVVSVYILAQTVEAADALKPQIRAAFEALPEFMFEEGGADAAFEGAPDIYSYVMTFRLRTRR